MSALGRLIKKMGAQVTITSYTSGVEDLDHGDETPIPASVSVYATHDRLKEPITIQSERGETVTVNSIFHVAEEDAPTTAQLRNTRKARITDTLGDRYEIEASGPADELGTRRLYCSRMVEEAV